MLSYVLFELKEPYKLPEGFVWCNVDITKPAEAEEAYDLLNKNYVEDDDNMFRFDYSPAFLEWALTPPGKLLKPPDVVDDMPCLRQCQVRLSVRPALTVTWGR